jgi:hypothetical protein
MPQRYVQASAGLKDMRRPVEACAGWPMIMQASNVYAGFEYMQAGPAFKSQAWLATVAVAFKRQAGPLETLKRMEKRKGKLSAISLSMPVPHFTIRHKLATLGTRYSTLTAGDGYWLYVGTAVHISLHFRRLLYSTSHCTMVTTSK